MENNKKKNEKQHMETMNHVNTLRNMNLISDTEYKDLVSVFNKKYDPVVA